MTALSLWHHSTIPVFLHETKDGWIASMPVQEAEFLAYSDLGDARTGA